VTIRRFWPLDFHPAGAMAYIKTEIAIVVAADGRTVDAKNLEILLCDLAALHEIIVFQ
jgi:hypothetical protein